MEYIQTYKLFSKITFLKKRTAKGLIQGLQVEIWDDVPVWVPAHAALPSWELAGLEQFLASAGI